MNDILSIDFGGATLNDIISRPDAYPEEVQAAYLDALIMVSKQMYDARRILEARLLDKMEKDNATKLIFKGIDGRELVATRKAGSPKCDKKDADEYMKAHGFPPTVIGSYEFVPKWNKAKESRKLGSDIQIVIDEIFKPTKEKIEISEKS